MSSPAVAHVIRENVAKKYKTTDFSSKLHKIDKSGKIYIPSLIRKLFKGYLFFVLVENGKIILDPVKIEDFEEDDSLENETT